MLEEADWDDAMRRYYGGCDGAGTDCNNADCTTAFHVDSDTHVQVGCQADNVGGLYDLVKPDVC